MHSVGHCLLYQYIYILVALSIWSSKTRAFYSLIYIQTLYIPFTITRQRYVLLKFSSLACNLDVCDICMYF